LDGNVASDQTITINGLDIGAYGCGTSAPATLTAAASFTNAGTIDLYSQAGCNNGSAQLVVPSGATLTNSGTLTTSGTGGQLTLEGDVIDNGKIDVAAGSGTLTYTGISSTLTVEGALTVESTSTLTTAAQTTVTDEANG
jgi:hypothetical protein